MSSGSLPLETGLAVANAVSQVESAGSGVHDNLSVYWVTGKVLILGIL